LRAFADRCSGFQVFKTIPQEPAYEIDESGAVRHARTLVLKAYVLVGKGSYLGIAIGSNTARGVRRYRVHRLVAQLFLLPDASRPHVNHIDGNKLNNHVSNLEWCTPEENHAHAKRLGLCKRRSVRT
jgi:hypothetical protein